MLGLDDCLSRGALGLASEVWVLDGDVEPKLVLLELPSDAALVDQPSPVSDDATTVAADFEGLGLVEVGLNYLGEAAKSHAYDGPIESSAEQLRDDIGRGEMLVECLCRVDCLGQCDQTVSQCAIANELVARAPECIGVDLVDLTSALGGIAIEVVEVDGERTFKPGTVAVSGRVMRGRSVAAVRPVGGQPLGRERVGRRRARAVAGDGGEKFLPAKGEGAQGLLGGDGRCPRDVTKQAISPRHLPGEGTAGARLARSPPRTPRRSGGSGRRAPPRA